MISDGMISDGMISDGMFSDGTFSDETFCKRTNVVILGKSIGLIRHVAQLCRRV